MFFSQRIVLFSSMYTSFRSGPFFCIFYILLLLLGRYVVLTNLVLRIVHIGYLSVFVFDIPVFSSFCLHRFFLSIFVCVAVLVRVLFLFCRSNCSSHLVGRTCVHVSMLLSCLSSCHFFLIFFFSSLSPVDLPITERNFDAISSAGVTFSNSQFFST